MKIRSLLTLTVATVALLATARGADAPEAKAAPVTEPAPKAEPAAKNDDAKGKLVLEKGLEAEIILKGYGKPYEIQPMAAPDKDTKVERWIYRRKVKETTTQTATGQTMVPAYAGYSGGGAANLTEVAVPEYKLIRITIYQVTELLMINGKLQVAKQWMGQEENHN